MATKGINKSFDVDFAHCNCVGTKHALTGLQVVSVQWKRTDKDPNGRVRFQCQRCKMKWSMNNVRTMGSGLNLDANHPEEIKRRRAIPYFYETVAVNHYAIGSQSPGTFPGAPAGRINSGKAGHA